MAEAVRMGMHGFGMIGRVHWHALQTASVVPGLGPQVVWKQSIVRNLLSTTGDVAQRAFQSVTDGLDSVQWSELDAIDVVSANDAHFDVVTQACGHGVHVYCEKPLSANVEDSRAMLTAAQEAGVVHQVALVNRFHPAVEHAYGILQSGVLGEVLTFRASLLHGSYLDPNRKMAWRLQKAKSGGGAISDLGVHMIDLVQMLLGRIAQVETATLKTFVPQRTNPSGGIEKVDVDDWASLQVTLENGASGAIEVSRVHLGLERNEVEIICRNGTLYIDLASQQEAAIQTVPGVQVDKFGPRPLAAFRIPPKISGDLFLGGHAASLLVFLHRIRGGTLDYPVPTFADAVSAEEVVHTAQTMSRA